MKKAKVVAVNLAKGDYQLRGWKDLDTSSFVTMDNGDTGEYSSVKARPRQVRIVGQGGRYMN